MQWWAWVIIWVGLVLCLLGMFVFFGWRLVVKGLAVLRELEALAEKVSELTANVEALTPEPTENAILVGYAVIADRRDQENERRARAKQLRKEDRLRRGKLLISSPLEGRPRVR
jgi:hypothetical protein